MLQSHAGTSRKSLPALAIGAIGVVYGDIGTSPLYALQECFSSHHALEINRLNVYGLLSLIFWAVMLVVSFKYVTIILRADNDGEGGSLALLAQVSDVVTPQQLRVLVLAAGQPGLNLSAVAADLDVHPSNASRVVDRLVDAGLLVRAEAPDDRRHVRLALSPSGRTLLALI